MNRATKNARQLAKEQAELVNFEAFQLTRPDFASRPVVRYEPGGDPPDILCFDDEGRRIGVELVQWINEEQTAKSKTRLKVQSSYTHVIRSWDEKPPKNVGFMFINLRAERLLRPDVAVTFRSELYNFIAEKDAVWLVNPDWDDPQGWSFEDFGGFPTLAQYLGSLEFYSRGRRFSPSLGSDWIQFHAHGGAYTSDWMRDALIQNVRVKVGKYIAPRGQQKLTQERLDEFYLLAYYDEAMLFNTPYDTPSFGLGDAASAAAEELSAGPHPFDKVFLFSSIEKIQKVIQVYPDLLNGPPK